MPGANFLLVNQFTYIFLLLCLASRVLAYEKTNKSMTMAAVIFLLPHVSNVLRPVLHC